MSFRPKSVSNGFAAPRRFFRRTRQVPPGSPENRGSQGNRGSLAKKPRVVIRKRPAAPPFWINIAPYIRRENTLYNGRPEERERHWTLVLQAKRIPHRFHAKALFSSLYVPPVSAHAAMREILGFEREKPVPPLPKHASQPYAYGYLLLMLALAAWHYCRFHGAASFPALPQNAAAWPALAGLDAYKVATLHEWWRTITALTLHADAAHLVANAVLGGLFGVMACGYAGLGFGALLILLTGALGNAVTAYLRPAAFLSIGFSTAVFATIGLFAAFCAVRAAKHAYEHKTLYKTGRKNAHSTSAAVKYGLRSALPPLAAGLGLLAMFGGSEAPNVDYLAHVMGFFSGIIGGTLAMTAASRLFSLQGRASVVFQWCCFGAVLGLVLFCWSMAVKMPAAV
ncbi:MAG: hypothetical protein DELT_00870 [Desulfovibrio sp.]